MEEIIKISSHERRQHFLYLLLLFFIAGSLCIWIIFRINRIELSGIWGTRDWGVSVDEKFLKVQQEMTTVFNSTISNIKTLKEKPENSVVAAMILSRIALIRRNAMDVDSTQMHHQVLKHFINFLQLYKDETDRSANLKYNIGIYKDRLTALNDRRN